MPDGPLPSQPLSPSSRIESLWRLGAVGGLGDGPLLDRFLSGDPAAAAVAFEVIVNRHGPMVLGLCQRTLGNVHDAEDAAQAAFLVLARRARGVRQREDLAPWLHGVARKIARRARADAAKRRRREVPLVAEPSAPDDRAGLWADLHDALDRLPDRERTPVILCHLEGLSQDEAAARLGWPLRTLQRRLTEGRARLRDRLSRGGVTAPMATAFLNQAPPVVEPASAWSLATARAAVGFAKTRTPTLTSSAASLARGVLKTMFWNELRRVVVVSALAGSAALGLARGFSQTKPTDPPPTEKPADAPVRRAFEGEAPDSATWHTAGVVVLDDATGKPIEGATLRVLEYVGFRFHDFATDANGRVRFEYPDPDGSGAFLEVRKPGYVPQRHTVGGLMGAPADATVTFRLRTGITIGGSVVNAAGEPVAGAKVVVTVTGYAIPRTRPALEEKTEITFDVPVTTDVEGRWTCSEVSPDADKVNLQILHPDYVSGGPTTIGGPGLRSPGIEVLKARTDRQVLKSGVTVTGRVTDSEGEPLAGATVTDTTGGLSFIEFLREATTDADGRFQFHFEEGERLTLTGSARGHGPADRAIHVKQGEPPLAIILPPAKTLRVRVIDPKGQPIPGVGAFIPTHSRYSGVFLRRYTDKQGRFHWDDAPDAEIPLYVSRKGYVSIPTLPVRPTEDEVTVTLTPAFEIDLQVRDTTSNAAVPNLTIETRIAQDPERPDGWSGQGRKTATNAIRHSIQLSSAQPHRIRVRAPGYKTYVSPVIKGDEGPTNLDVRLQPLLGPGLSGVVKRPDGTPEPGAVVIIGGFELVRGTVQRPDERSFRTETDAEGRFTLPPLDEPFPMTAFGASGFVTIDGEPVEEITLKPWGRIEGVALVGSKPMVGQNVSLTQSPSRPFNAITVTQGDGTTTDAEGRFTFEKVMPNPDVIVMAPFDGTIQTWAEVKPGETTQVTLGGKGRPVVGKLVRPEGVSSEDWAGARVVVGLRSDRLPVPPRPVDAPADWLETWWNSDEGRAYRRSYVNRSLQKTDPDGSFRFDAVEEGAYRLTVQAWTGVLPGRGPVSGRPFTVDVPLQVPPIPGNQSEEPLDLGTLTPTPREPGARPVPPPSSPRRAPE
ncbi:MAG: sigma-70 family RNA polymerase sigma factor [Isosphaeraceae bacterium]